MRRLFNVRIPVLFACALITGIVLGYIFAFYKLDFVWLIAVMPVTAVIFILCAVFVKRNTVLAVIILSACFLTAGAVNCYYRLENYADKGISDGAVYSVTAKVAEKGGSSYGEYLILTNLTFNGRKYSGKCYAYLSETYGDFCDTGYSVSFTAKITGYDLFPYGQLNYNAENNIKYSCSVTGNLSSSYGFSLFGSIRSAVRNTLCDNLDYDTAGVIYAMLTGDTQLLDGDTVSTFRYGGIAHIFAVSGLHIGIVYGLLNRLTKKLRLNKYVSAAICCGFIFFYAGICGFTLSSVRAAIMCTVSAAAKLLYRKYDGLNALAVSVILILTVTPLSIFSVGFQLSVCAVAGILFLSKRLVKLFKKLPTKIGETVSVSLSAQAATMPVMLVRFGYLSGSGLLMNIVFVPILSIIFLLLFLCTALSALFPVCAPVILVYSAVPLELLLSFLLNTGFDTALISGFGAGAFLPAYFLLLLFLSDKLNLKLLHRMTAVACAAVFLIAYPLTRTYTPINGYSLYVFGYYGGGAVLIKANGENVLIITEGLNTSSLQTKLNNCYSSDIDALIILGGENCADSYEGLGFTCREIYIYNGNIPAGTHSDVNYVTEFTLNKIGFRFTDSYGIVADCDGVSVCICANQQTSVDYCDILISQYPSDCACGQKIYFDSPGGDYNIYNSGTLHYILRNGKYSKY